MLRLTPERDIVPGVVRKVATSDDLLSVTLDLRDDLFFHPSRCFEGGRGRRATAHDLAYSLRAAVFLKMLRPPLAGLKGAAAPAKIQDVPGIDTTAPHQVRIRLARPWAVPDVALAEVKLIPQELDTCEAGFPKTATPVGTGPFRVDGPKTETTITLVRANRHWDRREGARPFVDRVEVTTMPDSTALLAAVAKGRFDMVRLDRETSRAVVENAESLEPVVEPRFAKVGLRAGWRAASDVLFCIIPLPRRKGLLSLPEGRKAVAHAIDRSALTSSFGLLHRPWGGILLPGIVGYNPRQRGLEHDLDLTRRMLAKVAPSQRGELVIGAPEMWLASALAMARQLRDAGIEARAVDLPVRNWAAAIDGESVDALLAFVQTHRRRNEAFNLFQIAAGTDSASGVKSERLERIVDELLVTHEPAERERLYGEIERVMLDELQFIPVAIPHPRRPFGFWVFAKRLRGAFDPATGLFLEHTRHWLAEAWLADR